MAARRGETRRPRRGPGGGLGGLVAVLATCLVAGGVSGCAHVAPTEPPAADTGAEQLAGVIQSEVTGEPFALYELVLEGQGVVRQTRTNSEGLFRFDNLPSGRYELLIVDMKCASADSSRTVEVKRGAPTRVVLSLHPGCETTAATCRPCPP